MASQITKNRTMKMTLRRLLLAISLYTRRILRHRRYAHSGAASRAAVMSATSHLTNRSPSQKLHDAIRSKLALWSQLAQGARKSTSGTGDRSEAVEEHDRDPLGVLGERWRRPRCR